MKNSVKRWLIALVSALLLSALLLPIVLAASGDTIVYVTDSGEKYHKGGCQYLSRSKNEITLEDAVSSGYGRCSKCNPPRLTETAQKEQSPAAQTFTAEEVETAVKEAVAEAELADEIYLNEVVENMQKEHKTRMTVVVIVFLAVLEGVVYLFKKRQ